MTCRFATVVVEGATDVPVARRLLEDAGLGAGTVHVTRGKARLDGRLTGYNAAARHADWLVLRDLDQDRACAPDLVRALLPRASSGMHFRVAVRSIEAWLMADERALTSYFRLRREAIPADTEAIDDPKRAVGDIARGSRDRSTVQDMGPAAGTTARVGPGYAARIIEFALTRWRPGVAARRNRSLAKCIAALRLWSRS